MAFSDDDLDRFLAGYGTSLAERDAETAADLWGRPGLLLSDDVANITDDRATMIAGLRQGYPMLDRLDLAEVRHTLLERVDVTERIVRVRVRWHFHDSAGEHLTDGDDEYVLRLDDDGPHAYVAIGIDEQEKMVELAARKGIDLGG